MKEFKLTDPYGTAPAKAPFKQSVSTGTPWHNMPVTREYTLGQLLDQTIARCGENDAVVYADRDFRLSWFEFGEEEQVGISHPCGRVYGCHCVASVRF